MKVFGKGFNFSQDGPGNRLVFHLSGCNMHCIWCSNPEGMDGKAGKEYTPEQIVRECLRARAMFFGGGGVTFTGGEATLWHGELMQVLQSLKAAGIHTALETNGTSGRLLELLPYVDYLMMDFKHYDGKMLAEYTGRSNEGIKHNFERISSLGRQLHIRIPLINGFNTASPEGFAEYFSAYDTQNTVFEFLPYHEYGKEKWTEEYKVRNGFITREALLKFHEIFDSYGLRTVRT